MIELLGVITACLEGLAVDILGGLGFPVLPCPEMNAICDPHQTQPPDSNFSCFQDGNLNKILFFITHPENR